MKYLFVLIFLFAILTSASCSEGSSLPSSSVAKVTDLHTTYPIGQSLVIEITPNKSAEAGMYYIIMVSYLKKGRCHTTITWTDLEIQLEKAKNVYVPLTKTEASTLYTEPASKISEVFGISIEPEPVDVATMQDFIKQGIVVIYN